MVDTVQRSGATPSTRASHLPEKLSIGSKRLFGDPRGRPSLRLTFDALESTAPSAVRLPRRRRPRLCSGIRRQAGVLFAFDHIDVSEDAGARYRPAVRKLRDNATAEIFVRL
jgi:hypothetical protein